MTVPSAGNSSLHDMHLSVILATLSHQPRHSIRSRKHDLGGQYPDNLSERNHYPSPGYSTSFIAAITAAALVLMSGPKSSGSSPIMASKPAPRRGSTIM